MLRCVCTTQSTLRSVDSSVAFILPMMDEHEDGNDDCNADMAELDVSHAQSTDVHHASPAADDDDEEVEDEEDEVDMKADDDDSAPLFRKPKWIMEPPERPVPPEVPPQVVRIGPLFTVWNYDDVRSLRTRRIWGEWISGLHGQASRRDLVLKRKKATSAKRGGGDEELPGAAAIESEAAADEAEANIEYGQLPLILSAAEVELLRYLGPEWISLVSTNPRGVYGAPDNAEVALQLVDSWNAARKDDFRRQISAYREHEKVRQQQAAEHKAQQEAAARAALRSKTVVTPPKRRRSVVRTPLVSRPEYELLAPYPPVPTSPVVLDPESDSAIDSGSDEDGERRSPVKKRRRVIDAETRAESPVGTARNSAGLSLSGLWRFVSPVTELLSGQTLKDAKEGKDESVQADTKENSVEAAQRESDSQQQERHAPEFSWVSQVVETLPLGIGSWLGSRKPSLEPGDAAVASAENEIADIVPVYGAEGQLLPQHSSEALAGQPEFSQHRFLSLSVAMVPPTPMIPSSFERLPVCDLKDVDVRQLSQNQMASIVFIDLWRRGYHATGGLKFGGDFLVYPGAPLYFHSHFVCRVVPFDRPLQALDIVSHARLASDVKKVIVLASVVPAGSTSAAVDDIAGFPLPPAEWLPDFPYKVNYVTFRWDFKTSLPIQAISFKRRERKMRVVMKAKRYEAKKAKKAAKKAAKQGAAGAGASGSHAAL